ncbi:MAG: DUF5642 family protein [Rhodococcus sp.]|nr:DUF5642 family protein [Rhodococcus sp. (in: high G+C Gram-positive bacteria)]
MGAVCLAAGLFTIPLVSCSTTVDGHARPEQLVDLSKLLLAPAEFPEGFDAVVLPPQAVSVAAPDLTGVPQNAAVEPSGCTPPQQDYGPVTTAMAVGTDNDTRATISVELTRSQATVDELEDQAIECGRFAVTSSGTESTVTTQVMPPPPIDADDTLALRRTVQSGGGREAVVQSMTTLIASIGDVRVAATMMSFGPSRPNLAPLDETFVSAVQKVQRS